MKKVKRLLRILLGIISIILSVTLIIELKKVGMIPSKYFKLLVIGISFIDLLILLFVTIKYKVLHVIGILMSLLLSIGSIIGIDVSRNANILIKNVFTDTKVETIEYNIVVLKDSKYTKKTELEDKNIGYYSMSKDIDSTVIGELNKQVKIKEKGYVNFNLMKDDLYNGVIEGLILHSGTYENLCENDANFKESTRILESIDVKFTRVIEGNEQKNDNALNIYISGIDTAGKITTVSRSDVNIILTINPDTHQILLTSIPRDTYVQLHNTTGMKDKLTHAGYYGINMSIDTIEDFLNINIDNYLRVNFESLVKFIDAIGGVTVNNDEEFKRGDYYFPKGKIYLNGDKALVYARERKNLKNGDYSRGEHQEEIIRAVINKVTTDRNLLLNYSKIMNSMSYLFQTDLSDEIFKKYVQDQLETMPNWIINSISIKCKGDYNYTYSIPSVNTYVGIPDSDSVTTANKLINGIESGKTYDELKK